MKLKNQFRVSGLKDKVQKMKDKWMSIPSRRLLTIQKIRRLILSLCTTTPGFRSETSKLASNTASFSCVVNVDGIKTLEEEDTLPFTLDALCRHDWR